MVNGHEWGGAPGRDEQTALDDLRRYVDAAVQAPDAFAPYWQPGARCACCGGRGAR